MQNNKIIITGASGFIGKHLWQYFNANEYSVIACTNSDAEEAAPATIIHRTPLPNPHFATLIEEEKPNYLIHCAGSASVSDSFINPQNDFYRNVVVTEFVLNTLKNHSPSTKMIFLSSAAVYGNPLELPIRVNTPINPISPYGFHKSLCEINCKKYHQLFDIPLTIARIFSVYGPGLKKTNFMGHISKMLFFFLHHIKWDRSRNSGFYLCYRLGTSDSSSNKIFQFLWEYH